MMRGFSRRHLKRLATAEVRRLKTLQNTAAIQPVAENEQLFTSEVQPPPSVPLPSTDTSSSPPNYPSPLLPANITDMLRNWYNKFNPSRESFKALLLILKQNKLDVPLSLKGLLGENQKIIVKPVAPGEYFHIGVEKQLLKILTPLKQNNVSDCLLLDIGIDGLPLYKSSRQTLWPILGHAVNLQGAKVFVIGSFLGKGKPDNADLYLEDLVDELKCLGEKGLFLFGRKIVIKVRAFICDAPARAFLCGIMGHNSLHGCAKCIQVGKSIQNVVTYSVEAAALRGDDDFLERKHINHHQKAYANKKTALENLGIRMVSQFPLDPMHLLVLGVTKKMLILILTKQTKFSINNTDKQMMSIRILSLSSFMPAEFARKPRSFDEIKLWKATEFRQFILYLGIVVLKNIVHSAVYYHFLHFHIAYRLLSSKKSFQETIDLAEMLFNSFVKFFTSIYPEKSVTYNVHNMLHITQCVREFGYIHELSAYKFENFLQQIKRKIKKPTKILQQMNKQFSTPELTEKLQDNLFKKNKNGKVVCYSTEHYFLTSRNPNNICCMKPCAPIEITGFDEIDGKWFIVGRRFLNVQPFFIEPINSMTALGIVQTDQKTSERDELFEVQSINYKYVRLPFENSYVMIPLLHTCI